MLDKYTVTLRGQVFALYRDQIEFDAPNYFSGLFLGDFSESQTRTVELSRSPDLFRIIVDYMSGYTILPLPATLVPLNMTSDVALENLARDAEFYGLQQLVELLRSHPSPKSPDSLFAPSQSFGLAGPMVLFSDLLGGSLPLGATCDQRGVGSARGGTWHPVPLKATGLVLVACPAQTWDAFGGSVASMTLGNPLIHHALPNMFAQRGVPVALGTSTLDGMDFHTIPCTLAPSAHTSVEGVNAAGAVLSSQITYALHNTTLMAGGPLKDALLKILRAEGNTLVVLLAEEVVFTIQSPVSGVGQAQLRVLAARFISRLNSASRLL
ncbi:hypothetical protein EXIGLDRAFT_840829 [Exidia glandulosa HHB12029]|uniref:BTB domain-containing protein n=1 Tax=Exidia glandulosa HHB12029 TaxID=1314781 RepID=A0A165E9A4_EXIGL|nr:hypothetical protein EXIGLDRAFT_840829 [Exidia glandulosa HHB12029]